MSNSREILEKFMSQHRPQNEEEVFVPKPEALVVEEAFTPKIEAPRRTLMEMLIEAEHAAKFDPARAEAFAMMLREHAPTIAAAVLNVSSHHDISFPVLGEMSHFQMTIFDNWKPFDYQQPKGRKARQKGGRLKRFVAQIELWKGITSTVTSKNRYFKANAPFFWDEKDLIAHLDTIPAFGLAAWQEYRETLISIVSQGFMVAPVYRTQNGTTYLKDVFLIGQKTAMDTHAVNQKLIISMADQGQATFEEFSTKYHDESALRDNAHLTARLNRTGGKWATGDLGKCQG